MNLLQTIGLVWTQYRTFRAVLSELESYSHGELNDLGIARGDISRIAYEEAERRVAALAASRHADERHPPSWAKPATP